MNYSSLLLFAVCDESALHFSFDTYQICLLLLFMVCHVPPI